MLMVPTLKFYNPDLLQVPRHRPLARRVPATGRGAYRGGELGHVASAYAAGEPLFPTEAYDDGPRVIKFDTGERHRYKPASLHKIKVTVGEDAAAAAAAGRRRSWLPSLNPSGLSQSSPV